MSISIPECPPKRPFNSIKNPCFSEDLNSSGKVVQFLLPPAQPTNIHPSSSESRFNIYFPVKTLVSKFLAPVIPTSSSVVISISNSGCLIVFDARSAIP